MRTVVVAAALVLLLAPPLTAGQAQVEACRAPVLALQPPPETFEPGGAYHLLFSIENPNGAHVDAVRATITTTTPAGWTATVGQRELTLAPKAVAPQNTLVVVAPHRGSGEASGSITLLVTFVCTSGDVQTSASSHQVLGVAIEPFQAPWPVVLVSFLALATGVVLLGIRRLRRGVAFACHVPERLVAPGKSAKFELVVENRRGRPQRFHLLPVGVPSGWQIHLALDEVGLEPGEEKKLWVLLKAPAQALAGEEAVVTLRLEHAKGPRESAKVQVRARVTTAGSEAKVYSAAHA